MKADRHESSAGQNEIRSTDHRGVAKRLILLAAVLCIAACAVYYVAVPVRIRASGVARRVDGAAGDASYSLDVRASCPRWFRNDEGRASVTVGMDGGAPAETVTADPAHVLVGVGDIAYSIAGMYYDASENGYKPLTVDVYDDRVEVGIGDVGDFVIDGRPGCAGGLSRDHGVVAAGGNARLTRCCSGAW